VQFGQVGLLPVESGAVFGEEEVEELAGGAAIALTEGVGEVRVVVQVRDGAREICLGNSLELLEAVNLRGDMVYWLADAAGGQKDSSPFSMPTVRTSPAQTYILYPVS